MKDLNSLRKEIDDADRDLLKALAARMRVVQHILAQKEARDLPLFDKGREREVLLEVAQKAAEIDLDPRLAQRVVREIISHARTIQARKVQEGRNPELTAVQRVAYQGTKGAYSWLACRQHFGTEVETVGYPGFEEGMKAVEDDNVDVALMPIENVLAGSIYEVYDYLAQSRLYVIGEEILRIEHCLIGLEDVPMDQIRAVLSHPKALQQCTHFIQHMPNASYQSYVDSAEAVRKVQRDNDPTQTAIASREAAELYGLKVLRDGIADHPENYTRFWVIARDPVKVDPRIPAKTSVFLVTEHREGALVACLSALAAQGVNLTKLESRPRIGMPWQYQFHLDMEGNLVEERMNRALDDVRSRARVLRILGCYPRADAQVARPPATTIPTSVTREQTPRFQIVNGQRSLAEKATRKEPTTVWVGEVPVGGDRFAVIAGSNVLQSAESTLRTAEFVKSCDADILHGVIQRQRTRAYSNQEVRATGLDRLAEAGRLNHLPVMAEVSVPEDVQHLAQASDLLRVSAENMQNISLLHELGRAGKPVLLERGTSSTVDELLRAADFILAEGNQQVILCERGIRTFEHATRFTLDLNSVLILKEMTHLPVILDPCRAAGSASRIIPLALAAKAVGADGIVIELATPDEEGQDESTLYPEEFVELMRKLRQAWNDV